jgi:hypothetical protein
MINPTRHLTCAFANVLDRLGTLSRQAGLKPATRAPWGKRGGLLAIGCALCLLALSPITDKTQASNYKKVITKPKLQVIDYQIYTLKKLRSIRQFNCAVTLWNRESNWRPKAHNSGHYGIVQGKSTYLKSASATQQIDWGLSYIRNRYGVDEYNKTNVCLALGHSYKNMWY